jgi:DNA-binding winged helix-turn-helix (wHTH) protein
MLGIGRVIDEALCGASPYPTDKLCYTLAFGKDLVIDPNARTVYLKGRELSLTKKEFDLLFCLASNPGKVFSREQLYNHVWDDTSAYNVSGVVKTHISSLRQKMIGADAEYIKNIWGVGYKFESKHSLTISVGLCFLSFVIIITNVSFSVQNSRYFVFRIVRKVKCNLP